VGKGIMRAGKVYILKLKKQFVAKSVNDALEAKKIKW